MKYREIEKDIFTTDDKYYIAHCISRDCEMGLGIAKKIEKRFKVKDRLLALPNSEKRKPTCLKVDRILNLVTKRNYWDKPTYKTMRLALMKMKEIVLSEDIKYLAMPRIGCGLDKLNWIQVRNIVKEIFEDTDIKILVCYLKE